MPDTPTVILLAGDTALAERLAARHGLRVLLTGDLYDAAEGQFALEVLRQAAGPLVVAGPYYPRAAYWMLRARGVEGRRADLPGAASGDGRAIHCLDTTGLGEAEIERNLVTLAGAGGSAGQVTDLREPMRERWYPVIDYDRCVHCLQCAEFCLFGVYDVTAEQRAAVADGDLCKPGCPACSRVCPAAAIIFPRYHGRGPIAGDDRGRPPQMQGDQARQASAPDVAVYKRAREGRPDATGARQDLSPEALLNELESFDAE